MMEKSFLSDRSKEIILGSILGDGSLKIHKPYKNARFSFRHSIGQKDYFFWKAEQLKEISGDSYYWIQKSDGFGGEKIRYQSLALEFLTELYRLTHKNGQFTIKRRWLNMITPLSLAIWWLDDGSLIVNSRRGVICTDPFNYEDQKILARYLQVVWGIKVIIAKTIREYGGRKREYYRLWIRSSEELKKLMRIILPHIKVASMLPKVLFLYRNSELQQRWISEVSLATSFSKEIIEKYVAIKKAKWKNFRE